MNINIYDEASILALSTTERNFNDKHTISSRNKLKLPVKKNTFISQSDCTVQQCLQSLDEKSRNRRTVIHNTDMYDLGQQFLNQRQQRNEWMTEMVEKQRMQECTFSPQLTKKSRMLSSQISQNSIRIPRNVSINVDSRTQKLEKELEECTFSPRILKTQFDKFDRCSPMYDRQLEWQETIKTKNLQSQMKRDSQLLSKVFTKSNPKQMDLRNQHALRKNISAKYLRMSMIESNMRY